MGPPGWELFGRVAGAVAAAAGGEGVGEDGVAEPGVDGGGVREVVAAGGAGGEEGLVELLDGAVVDDEAFGDEEGRDEEVEEEAEGDGAAEALAEVR